MKLDTDLTKTDIVLKHIAIYWSKLFKTNFIKTPYWIRKNYYDEFELVTTIGLWFMIFAVICNFIYIGVLIYYNVF